MDKLRHYKGASFWTYTLDTTDHMYPVQVRSGVRSHLSRNVFEQISARLFLESLEQGPFEQGAGSASDGTVVQRVDDAPAEIPAEELAPSRPSSPPKPRLASQPPAPSRPAPALAVARPEPEPEPARVKAPPPASACIRWRNRQATQPVLSVVAPAARPSSTPSPANATTAVTRAIRTAAQTSGDIRDNFDIKTGNLALDAAVAGVSRHLPPAEPVPFRFTRQACIATAHRRGRDSELCG